ncbi:hypothetical protein [Protaetiibacter intestinalis]|uniref:hypothetical protein n=1 Tax=Protaetiibacter intestinalis TaxID=2419774 RepID=UPI00130029B6|nr:hypothetical protein [Protaetiibacter intestinalis]
MSGPTRVETEETRRELRRELRRDARREFVLVPQALLALAIVAAVVWVREAFFV